METFFRIQPTNRPDILNPQNHTSYSWNDQGDDERARPGISAMRSRESLAEYLATVGMPFEEDWELLEIEGHYADDEDEDADLGAVLVIPTAIISRETLSDGFLDEINEAFDNLEPALI